jgi:hypothetical protein
MRVFECALQAAEVASLLTRPPETGSRDSWHTVQERTREFAVSLHAVLVEKLSAEASAK